MKPDEQSLDRFAQYLIVQYKKGIGSPPKYGSDWRELYGAKLETITDNINATPSEAVFWMPEKRWDDETVLGFGDKIRIMYYPENQSVPGTSDSTAKVLFVGFVTKILRQFSGGDEKGGKYERLGFQCLDIRWLLAVLSPCYGQIGRSRDNYDDYGTPEQAPKPGDYTDFTGRRCVFNAKGLVGFSKAGKPDKDKQDIVFDDGKTMPCFANPGDINAEPWTARQKACYTLSRITNLAYDYFPIDDPSILPGLEHEDWGRVLNNISVEGLNTATTLQFICKQIGWAYRIDYDTGESTIVFFRAGLADQPPRRASGESSGSTTLLHTLFAPAPIDANVNETAKNVKTAVEAGKIMLWAAQFEPDITSIINAPLYFGSPYRVEFTAELVPAWLDSDFVPDTANNCASLFYLESELQEMDNPDQYDFFKKHHVRGSQFVRNVGRIWALNESGRYTAAASGDRGMPFDLASVMPANLVLDKNSKRLFGPFDREFLPCLTKHKETDSSLGIVVEFSFDGGLNWEVIPAAMINLEGQCGVCITEPNLAEIKLKEESQISEGALALQDLNYYTSIARDKLDNTKYINEESGEINWKTRVRVTASIQLDQRLGGQLDPVNSGSPFWQSDIWDKSADYHYQQRDASSVFSATTSPVDVRDDYEKFRKNIEKLRDTMRDSSISGQFTLERLWLDTFRLGDCIDKIEGRDYIMRTGMGMSVLCPEIVQIIYLVQKQKMKLITRDLRFSEAK